VVDDVVDVRWNLVPFRVQEATPTPFIFSKVRPRTDERTPQLGLSSERRHGCQNRCFLPCRKADHTFDRRTALEDGHPLKGVAVDGVAKEPRDRQRVDVRSPCIDDGR
jgi:hypothetical protein